MELTVQNVYGLLLRSKLLPLEEARAMYARWQAEAGDAVNNLTRFAAWMVAREYVTEYQANLLARGHADGFFLGEYKILDRLGKGRMAGVYRAQHRLGQGVAIKVLPPSKARDAMLLGRFQREARLALQLKHPNTVRAFQVGVAGDLHYLVMEYLEGETLDEVLQRRKQLPVEEAVRAVYQALQGLQHIHSLGLVHRDLKPANLMLIPAPAAGSTLGCTVKILDLGLGRALMEEGPDPRDPGLTGEGVLLGTPDYMAPEQARDPRGCDIRADIYSLGCVLYHLLTGQPPFPDTNIISQMIRHASEPPPPLRDFNPQVPDGLQQILNWMMAKEPSGRYATPERAARALEVFLAAGSVAHAAPDADPALRPYLTWLEAEEKRVPTPPAPPADGLYPLPTVPLPPPVPSRAEVSIPPPAVRPPSREMPAVRPDPPRREAGKAKKTPAPQPQPPTRPAAEVELVALALPPPPAIGLFHLSRRDVILFFLGAGSGLLAYAVGRSLAGLLARPRPRDGDPSLPPTP